MAATFHLQIVTPEREIFSGPVEKLKLPGKQAGFGIWKDHAPLIAALQPGVVEFSDGSSLNERIVIGGGFFQVAKNRAIVLADSAERPHEIDLARAQAAEVRAHSRVTGADQETMDIQRDRAAAALKRAKVRLKNAAGSGPGQG